jgi:parallel beta-helix repeat protein
MIKPVTPARRSTRRSLLTLLSVLIAVFTTLAPQNTTHSQAVLPDIWYDSFNKIVYIGHDYDPASPYAKYPSHPEAIKTKEKITIPQLATALNDPTLLEDQGGGAWLLKANVVISQSAELDATSPSISDLRLDTPPGTYRTMANITARGGYLNVKGISVTSWSGSGVDANYYDSRSYLLAELGGRMDIVSADVSYLGWSAGEPSGLAWRKWADPSNTATGATGQIIDSNIHNNYFGQYSYQAYGLVVLRNKFQHNVFYGFDPHDYSQHFEVAYNEVHDNGKHGIIFSRGCTNNYIHDNTVYNNVEHGIMLDRGSNLNTITDNTVYNNSDGVAIFESEHNLIQNNKLHDNERGVRINATFDSTDTFDGLATQNVVLSNTITGNFQYGIYLYERADKTNIISNTITGNITAGIYIKTGGNTIRNNTLRDNGDGISIVGSDPVTPGGLPPLYEPGSKNIIQHNFIEDNNDTGIQLEGAQDTLIGLKAVASSPEDANFIDTNGKHGISIDATSTKTTVSGNTIHGNLFDGVTIKGPASGPPVDSRNKVTRNSITANGRSGISVDPTANLGIQPPHITSALKPPAGATVTGTSAPNATVEVYRDGGGQGNIYEGSTTANASGGWSFTLPAIDNPNLGVTALAIDQAGNTSAFPPFTSVGGQASYEIATGRNGDLTIFVSGPGATVTLPLIQQAVQKLAPTKQLIENLGNGTWQANASLFINRGVTLNLTAPVVTQLRLLSQSTDIHYPAAAGSGNYNYKSFVTLRTYGGHILIDGLKPNGLMVTSWNPAANNYDTDITNGRSYILAKYDARLDIKNAVLSYLGSADGESYGVSWRDINDSDNPNVLLTRVTGEVLGSQFHHNYYGIYTFQASNMVFRGNKFYNNIGYGFDPHDYSNHFIVEDNESYANGNHGFIISRGCNNFVFRNNKSHDNHYTITNEDRKAHGFMLDPGSPDSQFAQVPSHDNLLENNQAWGNDGYGLRIVGSKTNTIQGNTFTGNLQGVTIEQGSTGNILRNNTIANSQLYGIYAIGGSDSNTITGNTITHSGKHGIYLKTGKNTISNNTVTYNGTLVDGLPVGSGIASFRESDVAAAAADLQLPGSRTSIAAADPDLLGSPSLASAVDGNVISNNTISYNADDGIQLKEAQRTRIDSNTIEVNGSNGIYLASGTSNSMISLNRIDRNTEYGIKANGLDVVSNQWTKNLVFDNRAGGIVITSGANDGMPSPTVAQQGHTVTITTMPGTIVEIYSDNAGQGRFFEARLTPNGGTITLTRSWKGSVVNAIAVDTAGNTSGFAINRSSNTVYLPLISR